MAKISTKAEQAAREQSIIAVLEEDNPQSVRHLFYRMLSDGTEGRVEKTKAGYRRIQYCAKKLRENGKMPFEWIADYGRSAHWNAGFGGVSDFMERYQSPYRRDLWVDVGEAVEVWCEARSMQGVIQPVCREFQVPLFPSGGYSSLSFLHETAGQIVGSGVPVTVYHVGDYDDAGQQIGRVIERDLQRMMRKITADPPPFRFVRLAVNAEQVPRYNLPSKPMEEVKKKKGKVIWDEVQAEAVPAAMMKEWLSDVLAGHLPLDALSRAEAAEREERRSLTRMARLFEQVGGGDLELLARKPIAGYDEYRAEYRVSEHAVLDRESLRAVRHDGGGVVRLSVPPVIAGGSSERIWHCLHCCPGGGRKNCRDGICLHRSTLMMWHVRNVHGVAVDSVMEEA